MTTPRKKTAKRPAGPAPSTAPKKRPFNNPEYSDEYKAQIVKEAIAHIEDGYSLHSYIEPLGLRFSTVWRWIEESGDADNPVRAKAQIVGTYALADKIQQVLENSTPETASADRVKVDGYFRLAGIWNRAQFGEKRELDITHRQLPDWSRLSPEAKAELRAALEAQVRAEGQQVPPSPLALPDGTKG